MTRYDYKCPSCERVEEQVHSMKDAPEFKCSKCGLVMERQISLSFGGFVLKGGTASTHWKEKRGRLKRSEEMAKRQQVHKDLAPKVHPNVAGHEVDTWRDAQKLAKEVGLNTDSYKPFVEKEKAPIII